MSVVWILLGSGAICLGGITLARAYAVIARPALLSSGRIVAGLLLSASGLVALMLGGIALFASGGERFSAMVVAYASAYGALMGIPATLGFLQARWMRYRFLRRVRLLEASGEAPPMFLQLRELIEKWL